MMRINLRDPACHACQTVTSGDCGLHGLIGSPRATGEMRVGGGYGNQKPAQPLPAVACPICDRRASEADVLNQELRENYGAAYQVGPKDDWRGAIRRLVDGVRHGERFTRGGTGWECPRCGRVHAPWVARCNCQPRTGSGSSADTVGLE